MCGRFTLRAPAQLIAEQFSLFELPSLKARFNVAPTQPILAVRQGAGQREAVMLHWGLVPSWAKDPGMGSRMINARVETVAEKPAYRAAFRRRRCLVVADGFYEWQKQGRTKQPYFIRMADNRPFAFAGIWESWEGADHSYLESCSLLTTAPNALMAPIHDRMPVILVPENYDAWLDPSREGGEGLLALCGPYPPGGMVAGPVGRVVNNPRNDSPECIAPLD